MEQFAVAAAAWAETGQWRDNASVDLNDGPAGTAKQKSKL